MAIVLNHTIVPSRDKEAGAKFFARIFGLSYHGLDSNFAPVRVNEELTLDYDNRSSFDSHHYAFHVNDDEFDAIFNRVKAAAIPYGSGPHSTDDMRTNQRRGGRGVYFHDPDGHLLELMTRV